MSLFYSVVRTTNSLNMRSYHDNKGYCCLLVTSLIANKISTSFVDIFPRTIAGGFFFPHQKRVIIRAKAIIRGRRLFQILLSRICALHISGAPNGNFGEHICSEDDLRTRIFGTFVVKFLACLPLLGFSNIYYMV